MQEYNLYSETDTRKIIIGKLQRMFSSCQINVLVGSAFSLPQLKTLENIESDLTTAILEQDENKEYKIKTNFFEKILNFFCLRGAKCQFLRNIYEKVFIFKKFLKFF